MNRLRTPIIFSFLLPAIFLSPVILVGQEPNHRYQVTIDHFPPEQGLTANITSAGIHDSRGFLWTPTSNGLARFDGDDFIHLTRASNNLRGNDIFQLTEDAEGFIWLLYLIPGTGASSSGKLDILDARTLQATRAEAIYPSLSKLDGIIIAVFTDPDKHIFILTDKGHLYRKLPQGDFKLLVTRPIQSPGIAHSRVFAGKKYVWVFNTDSTALCLLHDGSQLHEFRAGFDDYLHPLQPDDDDNMLVMKGSVSGKKIFPGIYKFATSGSTTFTGDYLSGKPGQVSGMNSPIRSSRTKSEDAMVIAHPSEGLFLRNGVSKYVHLLGMDKLEPYPDLLASYALMTDRNTCWFFSKTSGLYKVTFRPTHFVNYLGSSTLPPGLHQKYCQARGIYDDNQGNLYVNSWLGLLVASTRNPLDRAVPLIPNTNGLCISKVDDILYSFNSELVAYELPLKMKYRFYRKDNKGPGIVWSMYKTHSGRIWVGTENGLAYTDDLSREMVPFPLTSPADQPLRFVYQIIRDSDGGMWAATSSGLVSFDTTGTTCRLINSRSEAGFTIPADDIFCVYEDEAKNFWIGTNGSGLVKWNRLTGKSETYTVNEGMSSNVVYGILGEAGRKEFWMSSAYGLMNFNMKTGLIRSYTQKDGLAFNEFNRSSFHISNSGIYYFGGIDGVTSFRPDDFAGDEKPFEVPLQILSYNQFDNKSNTLTDLTGELLKSGSIVLNPGDKFFTLRFRLLNFEKEQPSYAYRFDGYDQDWNYISENSIRISNLPSGDYTLRIKGRSRNGKWSTRELIIPVTVQAPFYKHPLFMAGTVATVAFCTFGFFRWNTRKLKMEKLKLEQEVVKRTEKIEQQKSELMEMDKIKSRFFANISHELRTPLTLITGPVDAMLNGQYGELNPDLRRALSRTEKNGKQLMRFIEQILDLSRLETGKLVMNEKPVFLASELRKIESSFRELARTRHQEWVIDYKLPETLQIIMDDDKFEKILYNLLSNAFKFTPPFGTIKLVVRYAAMPSGQDLMPDSVSILFEVADTGKGIPAEDLPHIFDRFFQSSRMDESNAGGSGIGLAFARELTEALGGTLTAQSKQGEGSVFRLTLPFRLAVSDDQKVPVAVPVDTPSGSVSGTDDAHSPGIHLEQDHTILVVDDNSDMTQFICDILTPRFKVVTATDGSSAIRLLESQRYPVDFIITDVMMPGMDGFELLGFIKSHPEWRKLPVVILTAKATTEHKIKALRIGVDDYLYKPFSTAELLARVQNLLHHFEQRNHPVPGEPAETETAGTAGIQVQGAALSEYDLNWLVKAESLCRSHLSDSWFGVTDLADKLAVSERQLHRRINQLTGLTPNKYIREIKLQHARELLEAGTFKTVAEVAYKVAFGKPEYFSKLFTERFGIRPAEVLKS